MTVKTFSSDLVRLASDLEKLASEFKKLASETLEIQLERLECEVYFEEPHDGTPGKLKCIAMIKAQLRR